MLVSEKAVEEEHIEGLIEFPGSYGELFQSFCAQSSVHGTVRLISSQRNWMKPRFWALLITISLGLMCWQFSLILGQYFQNPLLFSITVNSKALEFPSVTVCTLNPHRPASVSQELRDLDRTAFDYLRFLCGYKPPGLKDPPSPLRPTDEPRLRRPPSWPRGASESDFLRFPLVRNSSWKIGFQLCNETGGDCFYQWQSSGIMAVRQWYTFHYVNILGRAARWRDAGQGGRSIGTFVYDCTFNGLACTESNYTSFQHPLYGSCYTFNGERGPHQWRSLKTGKRNGLSLLLKTSQEDNIPFLTMAAGARVMVHAQNTVPFIEDGGFDIQPGIETSISMRKEQVSRLGGKYGDCSEDGREVGVVNLFKGAYTQQACLRSCFQLEMASRCGCAHYFYPLPPGAQYCDYHRHKAWGHCYYRLYEEFTSDGLRCFRTCRRPCQQTEYPMVAGYGEWPSGNSEAWMFPILEQENRLKPFNRRDIAKLNIYYRELNYKTTSETPAVPAVMMLSGLGSQWSLWFGCSVLSVVELLELLLDLAALSLLLALGPRPSPSSTALRPPLPLHPPLTP